MDEEGFLLGRVSYPWLPLHCSCGMLQFKGPGTQKLFNKRDYSSQYQRRKPYVQCKNSFFVLYKITSALPASNLDLFPLGPKGVGGSCGALAGRGTRQDEAALLPPKHDILQRISNFCRPLDSKNVQNNGPHPLNVAQSAVTLHTLVP